MPLSAHMKPDHLRWSAMYEPLNISICSLWALTFSTMKGPWGVIEILKFGTENTEEGVTQMSFLRFNLNITFFFLSVVSEALIAKSIISSKIFKFWKIINLQDNKFIYS